MENKLYCSFIVPTFLLLRTVNIYIHRYNESVPVAMIHVSIIHCKITDTRKAKYTVYMVNPGTQRMDLHVYTLLLIKT